MRTCNECGVSKPLSEFYENKRSAEGHIRQCRTCVVKRSNEYRRARVASGRQKPPTAAARAKSAEWARNNPQARRAIQIRSKYGIEPEQFDAMYAAQNGCCATCRLPFHQTPHIDHNHVTGKVRGLLCGDCNKALGLIHDNPATAQRLADYLRVDAMEEKSCSTNHVTSP